MPNWQKRMLIRLAVLLPIAMLVYEIHRSMLNVHPQESDIQRVTVLNQPTPEPPKPPEAEIKPPEPLPSEAKQQFFKFDDYSPGAASGNDKAPPGPTSNTLGLDATGGPGSDAFGLAAKRGGRDITTLGPEIGGDAAGGPSGQGQGGPMAKFAGYAYRLRDTVTAALNAHPELRVANYDANIAIWIDPDGEIKRVTLTKSTGMLEMDNNIRHALESMPRLSLATPPDMPQPVDLRLVSKGASGYETKKTN